MPKINLGKVVGDKGEPFTFNDFTTEQLDGITPKILKGNVTTLDPDENAIVDIRKDGINNYIDFGIPRGKNGSELKDVSSENVVMADKTTLESTMTTVNENVSANSNEINKIKSPTFNDTVSTYSTLNDANTAAETTSNAIKNKVSIFTTLSNIKKSFSAIVQGLKILGTNVGAITGITSDLAGESETVAASIKAVNALNSKLSNWIDITSQCNWNVSLFSSAGIHKSFIQYNPSTKQVIGSIYVVGVIDNQQLIVTLPFLEGIGVNKFVGSCGIGITNKPIVIFPRIYDNGIFSSHTVAESTGYNTVYMFDFTVI